MANKIRAKRADRPNPREDRNSDRTSRTNSNSNLIELNQYMKPIKKKITLVPRNLSQEDLLASLYNPDVSIVFAVGPAGTGKTYLSTLWAIQEFKAGRAEKIVIARPNVAVDDKDIGFLPGDIFKKMAPWCMPILDVFGEYFSQKEIQYFLESGTLELCPIAYVRGRTFKNSIVIFDESQNSTPSSMLSVLTRIGDGSKMVVTGDVKQGDRGKLNGLSDFIERFSRSSQIALVRFEQKDVVRHPVIEEILEMYKDIS